MVELKGVGTVIVGILVIIALVMVVPLVVWLLGYWTLPFGIWTFQELWNVIWASVLGYLVIIGLVGLWLLVARMFQ